MSNLMTPTSVGCAQESWRVERAKPMRSSQGRLELNLQAGGLQILGLSRLASEF